MIVHVLRCISTRSRHPQVLAFVDGWRVGWTPADGWGCACGGPGCPHVPAVQGVLDPRVTGGAWPDWWPSAAGGSLEHGGGADGHHGVPAAVTGSPAGGGPGVSGRGTH